MSDVGIAGGMILQHMGTPAEVAAFFALIERHESESISGTLDLVTDRLYRRTVPGEQYDALVDQLAECRRILHKIRITDGFWDQFKLGGPTEVIDRSAKTAADAFQKIFQSLDKAIDYARADKKKYWLLPPFASHGMGRTQVSRTYVHAARGLRKARHAADLAGVIWFRPPDLRSHSQGSGQRAPVA